MENQKGKRLNLSKMDVQRIAALAVLVTLIVLIVALCISISMRSHMQSQYTSARDEIGEEVYTELYMLCQTFDQVTVPGQDVQNVVIPTMQDYYLAARTSTPR